MGLELWQALAPSPVQPVQLPVLQQAGVQLWIKRDDLLHPCLMGNKYRKSLVYVQQALPQQQALVSFGGAYSNHLLALAQIGQQLGLRSVGCVRGMDHALNTPVLARCRAAGMHLMALPRAQYYREQAQPSAPLQAAWAAYAPYVLIPEGGTSAACLPQVACLLDEIEQQLGVVDGLACAVGSGGTVAGLLYGMAQRPQWAHSRVLGLCAVKGYTQLPSAGQQALQHALGDLEAAQALQRLWLRDVAGRGFGRASVSERADYAQLAQQLGVPLDYVYTGKALAGFLQQLGTPPTGSGQRWVFVHTGGYQTAALSMSSGGRSSAHA